MNTKIILPCVLCLFCRVLLCSAQGNLVNVNTLTGAVNVGIPIYTVSAGQVSVPVTLVYATSGIRPTDVEGTAGMGFNVQAGGQVSRQVRGLPDDVLKDNANNGMYGWMSPLDTAANKIGFTIANDGATCTKETTDISYINSNFPYRDDTEPDLFSVEAPGLSCQMIYDRATAKFHPLNYADLIISFTQNPSTGAQAGQITSFTITNDRGIVYTFAVTDAGPSAETITQITSGSPTYFTNTYYRYRHGITYFTSWKLTSITDPGGNGVELDYKTTSTRRSTDTVILYTMNPTARKVQYKTFNTVIQCLLSTIITNTNGYLAFTWTGSSTGQSMISSITGYGRSFQFTYAGEPYTPDGFTRGFLKNYTDGGKGTPVNYSFSYLGESLTSSGYVTALPDSQTRHLDYWGYYSATVSDTTLMPSVYVNPSTATYQRYLIAASASPGSAYTYTLTNSGRAADTSKVAYGALNKIVYGAGGSSNIVYQSNDYYDVSSGQTVKGGGIRVKQLIDSVSTNSTNNIIRNYSYVNPSGISSGKPVTLPLFAFTTGYSGSATGLSLWQACTILSGNDLSDEDHTIMYAYAKESQAGAGSTLYNYYVPATNWDASANPDCSGCSTAEWAPTLDYVARNNCSSTYGPIKNDCYSYPFVPNPNYDFERGLPAQITSYKDDGVTKVSQTNFTYQRLTSPSTIVGFRWEDNPNGTLLTKCYNKYSTFYNIGELDATVNKITYASTGTAAQSDTVTYTFGSANHKLLTKETTNNSDGTGLTTNISYVKDYVAGAGTNPNVTALYHLHQENLNAPVESYQQYTSGGTTLTTSAGLTLFAAQTVGASTMYLPSEQLKMFAADGLSTFSKFTVSGQTTTIDPNYVPSAYYTQYDQNGYIRTVKDNSKNVKTTVMDMKTNRPTLTAANCAYNEFAFNDFDTKMAAPAYSFTVGSGGSYTPTGSHTGFARGLSTTQTVTTSATLAKNTTAANYIFSIWLNPAAAGQLTLTISGLSPNPILKYTTGGWKYYEIKVPANSISTNVTLSFISTQNVSMDDILFYPDVAEITTAAYDSVTCYPIAQTNTNGISTYFTNDQWGRRLYTYDRDKNIVQKNTFVTPQETGDFSNMTISSAATINPYLPTAFSVTADITAGTTVTWTFGDGSPPVTTAVTTSPTHTYTSVGTYTVKAVVTSPYLGTKTITKDITVTPGPMQLSYASYTTGYGDISLVTFTSLNGGMSYSVPGSSLHNTIISGGIYNISITLSDGKQYPYPSGGNGGYSSVTMTTDHGGTYCANYAVGNTYTFSNCNLSNCTTAAFAVSQFACGSN